MPKTLFFENYKMGSPDGINCRHGVAFLAHGNAHFVGINFRVSRIEPFPSSDWSSLKKEIEQRFGDASPTESEYDPGTAYKRIFWPLTGMGNLDSAIDTTARTQSFVALRLLLAKLVEVFENIEPAGQNLQVYGHKVRELLLLAAMEAEASWPAVLKANGYIPNGRLQTGDYVKLLNPMLLDSYSLGLTSYPAFPRFGPLRGWDPAKPTQSLDWYNAYNETKHNREEHLDAATFERAIHAVGAAVVMFYAQFGFNFAPGDERLPFIRSIFTMDFDADRHPHSCYIPIQASRTGPAAWDWKLLEYPFPP
jgi:hypothetical protein